MIHIIWTYWGFFFGQFGIWISITLFSWGIIFLQGHCLLFWFRWWNFILLFNFFALWFFSLFAFSFTFNLFCLTLKFIFSSAPVSSSRSFLFLEWLDSRFSSNDRIRIQTFWDDFGSRLLRSNRLSPLAPPPRAPPRGERLRRSPSNRFGRSIAPSVWPASTAPASPPP